jgi:hypothetical protein
MDTKEFYCFATMHHDYVSMTWLQASGDAPLMHLHKIIYLVAKPATGIALTVAAIPV